jgi:hypothetical protein
MAMVNCSHVLEVLLETLPDICEEEERRKIYEEIIYLLEESGWEEKSNFLGVDTVYDDVVIALQI